MDLFKLYNGLTVCLKERKEIKTISCGVWVNQGSKDEDCNSNGLSHLVEHLMFKIKCKNTSKDMEYIMQELKQSGAFYNAATSKDNTYFYIEGLNFEVNTYLEILSYIVTNKEEVEERDLEREKKIVLREAEELFMSSSQIANKIGQALWNDNCYGNSVIGSIENIKNFTCKMANDLIKNSYTPDNSILVVVGDFNVSEVKKGIQKFFSKWEGRINRKNSSEIRLQPRTIIDDKFKGNRTTIGLGFPGYCNVDIRFQYLEILKNIIVNPEGDLLKKLREEKGFLYSVRGYTRAFDKSGNMGIVFSADNNLVEEIITIIIEELRKIRTYGIDSKMFESFKKKRMIEVLFSINMPTEEMKTIASYAITGNIFSLKKYIQEIESLNLKKMNEVIKEVLKVENLGVATLGCADISKIIKEIKM